MLVWHAVLWLHIIIVNSIHEPANYDYKIYGCLFLSSTRADQLTAQHCRPKKADGALAV